MEVFNIFATLTLQDQISAPLAAIIQQIAAINAAISILNRQLHTAITQTANLGAIQKALPALPDLQKNLAPNLELSYIPQQTAQAPELTKTAGEPSEPLLPPPFPALPTIQQSLKIPANISEPEPPQPPELEIAKPELSQIPPLAPVSANSEILPPKAPLLPELAPVLAQSAIEPPALPEMPQLAPVETAARILPPQLPDMPQQPELAAMIAEPQLPTIPQLAPVETASRILPPELPDIPAIPELAPLAMNVQPPASLPQMPEISAPQIGNMPAMPAPEPLNFAVNPVLPENMDIPAPGIASPEMPDVASALKPVEIPSEMMRPELASMSGIPAVPLNYGELPPAPEIPEFNPSPIAFGELPQMPSELAVKSPVFPELPSLGIDAPVYPELPTLGLESPELPEMKPIVPLPELPELEMKVMPGEMGVIPDVNPPEITRVFPVPQPKAPDVAIPEPPVGLTRDNAMRQGSALSASTGHARNNQCFTVNIGEIKLPNVTDGESFLSSLKGALRNEIGQFEGAAS